MGRPRNMFRNRRVEFMGRTYPSATEAALAQALELRRQGGDIASWHNQPKFTLGIPENVYIADFRVVMPDGSIHIYDAKGRETEKFRHNVRLWKVYGEYPLIVWDHGIRYVVIPGEGKISDHEWLARNTRG